MKARTKLNTNDVEDLRMRIWKLSQSWWGWIPIIHVPMKVRQNENSDYSKISGIPYH